MVYLSQHERYEVYLCQRFKNGSRLDADSFAAHRTARRERESVKDGFVPREIHRSGQVCAVETFHGACAISCARGRENERMSE